MTIINGMRRLFGILWLAGTLLALAAGTGCKKEELARKLDEYLFEARWAWGFHGSALVAWNGKIILSKGYGVADREFGELHSADTKFFIGSITKQFTAAAVLKLHEQGELDIEAPISRYLPEYPRPAADKITVHHLLSHQSGIPNYTDVPEVLLKRTSSISPAQLLESFSQWPLQFEPGSEFQYSNSNYIVLGAVIEEVSGQSYEAFLHHYILGPLGMNSSGYARREAGIPGRAAGYTVTEEQQMIDAVPIHHSVLHTAGALYSNVEDMLKWDSALASPGTVLSASSIDAMLTPYRSNYGYGWFIDTLYDHRHTWHGGFIDGFNTVIERWPDQRLLVVVFSNDDYAPVGKIARGLAAIAFGEEYDFPVEKKSIPISPSDLAAYEGIFRIADDRYRYVTLEDDTLHTYITGSRRGHIFPQGIDTFFFSDDNTKLLIFGRDESGRITRTITQDQSGAYVAKRVSQEVAEDLGIIDRRAISLDPEMYDRYAGTYRMGTFLAAPSDDFNLTVTHRADRLYVSGRYTEEVELFPRTPTDFFHGTSGFEISFVTDSAGAVSGCVLRMAGAEVRGTKIE